MADHALLPRLDDVLANRSWLRRDRPFRHFVARDVFTPDFAASLAAQLGEILGRGLSDVPAQGRFSRGMKGYDAYGIGITEDLPAPLSLFISAPWRDLMCGLFGVEKTPYVFAGAHHHAPWGANGFIHNDFNPVWFPRAADAEEIRIPDMALCDFKTGAGSLPDAGKVETVRGAVILYYLLNDGWRPGDGGETGLFHQVTDRHEAAAVRCPPIDNSIVAFECTPQSFHAYLANRGRARTSIIMWVHRGVAEAAERHGADRIEKWR
ncbi:2OG-Fe(II) oxygenase [Hamadaea tsunoensis]|uniref:2OG-Fe(II) oxygenase n=1 Tax=Hamadaea tsunoensis TaxID=53368 RepID=UPI000413FE58|nr:2OG-Fe(II) oxygenase [Hamadaea tsunoensis]